LISEFPWSPG